MSLKHRKTRKVQLPVLSLADQARKNGRWAGYDAGKEEGYLRGRANYIVNCAQEPAPFQRLHVLYVSSGKGFPYSPLDEAIMATLQGMVAHVTLSDPRQPVSQVALETRPDLVLVLDGMDIPIEHIDAIRQAGIQTAIWLTDDPYYTDMTLEMVSHFDHVFTLELNCVELYRQHGRVRALYALRRFYQPLLPDHNPFSAETGCQLYRLGILEPRVLLQPDHAAPMSHNTVFNGIWWDRLPDYTAYGEKIELGRWMSPQETNDVYNGTKIVINLHRSHEDDSVNNNQIKIPPASPNPRTFEIAPSTTSAA